MTTRKLNILVAGGYDSKAPAAGATEERPNVYREVGLATGMDKALIGRFTQSRRR